ncbi:hypothetical protein WJ35_08575 [Burkholderia ubonensis]|uniref:Uncharacterized protein n=1 Tax=Burkholderia ubonensis TaxID=101571 RepID=A0A1B4LD57_9BURK|nr:hypothetical protein WJ35_08575 [Burkholderia ubonensis]
MPQTVPSSPTNGAVLPIDASSTWPNSSRRCERSIAWRSARSTRSLRSTRAASAAGSWSWAASRAASASGTNTRSRSAPASAAMPASSVGARQNAASAPGPCHFARTSSQAFTTRKHQLATDIAAST